VITGIAGEPIDGGDQLVRTISARAPGSDVELSVFRDGREMNVRAQLAERQAPQTARLAELDSADRPVSGDALGLDVVELSRKLRDDLSIAEDRVGVVVREVAALAPGADSLAHGDIIVEVNRRRTADKAAYQRAVQSLAAGEPAFVLVYRPRTSGLFLAKLEAEPRR
jgi:serine protease Do